MKYVETENSIKAVKNHLILVATLAEDHTNDEKLYLPREVESRDMQRRERFKNSYEKVVKTLLDMRSAYEKAIEKSNDPTNTLKLSAEEDFKMLTLPVTLTVEELITLVNRNLDNDLFKRAVREYAEKHGIRNTTLDAACAQLSAADMLRRNFKIIENYFEGYLRAEFYDAMRSAESDLDAFSLIANDHTFENLGG